MSTLNTSSQISDVCTAHITIGIQTNAFYQPRTGITRSKKFLSNKVHMHKKQAEVK